MHDIIDGSNANATLEEYPSPKSAADGVQQIKHGVDVGCSCSKSIVINVLTHTEPFITCVVIQWRPSWHELNRLLGMLVEGRYSAALLLMYHYLSAYGMHMMTNPLDIAIILIA